MVKGTLLVVWLMSRRLYAVATAVEWPFILGDWTGGTRVSHRLPAAAWQQQESDDTGEEARATRTMGCPTGSGRMWCMVVVRQDKSGGQM